MPAMRPLSRALHQRDRPLTRLGRGSSFTRSSIVRHDQGHSAELQTLWPMLTAPPNVAIEEGLPVSTFCAYRVPLFTSRPNRPLLRATFPTTLLPLPA